MKIKVFIGLVLSLFLIRSFPINAQTELKESVLYNNVKDVLEVYRLENYHLLKYEDKIHIKSSSFTLEIEGLYINHVENGGKVFVLYHKDENNLLAVVENQVIVKTITLSNEVNPSNISIQNNSLILMGSKNNFGYLSFYNYNLDLMNEYYYGENNGLEAKEIFMIDNKWYLFCEKDSHSSNGFFENIGSDKERKVCLLILNNQFSIEKIKYLNCDDGIESLVDIDYKDNAFWFIIKGETNLHFFNSDISLNNPIKVYSDTNLNHKVILNYQNEFLRFDYLNQLVMFVGDEKIDLFDYGCKGIYIEDGLLKFIYLKNDNLYLNEVNEYHIDYLNKFEISFFEGTLENNTDLNHTKFVEVNSYFGEVEVFLNSDINYRINGKYDVSLIIRRKGSQDILINNKLEIKPYSNVYEGGVYCSGKTLKFMGEAYLNGIEVTNGHQINTPGYYKLELVDNSGKKTTYNFEIVDEYYNRSELNYEYDYSVSPNDSLKITIDLPNKNKVKELWINDESIEFNQLEDKLEFEIYGKSSSCITEYKVEKLVYEDNEIDYDHTFKVYTTKLLPKISIFETESEFPLININVEDYDMSLLKLEIIYNYNDEEKKIDYYFNNHDFIIPELLNNVVDLRINLIYTNGLREVFKKNIVDFRGVFKKEQLFKIESTKNENGINNIKIEFNKINNLEKLTLIDESIKDNYNYVFSYTSLIISGSITLLIIGGIIFLIIKKRHKNKKDNLNEAIVE